MSIGQIGHNEISAMCRVALLAMGEELVDADIYQFAAGYNGGHADVETHVVHWAKQQ